MKIKISVTDVLHLFIVLIDFGVMRGVFNFQFSILIFQLSVSQSVSLSYSSGLLNGNSKKTVGIRLGFLKTPYAKV